MSFAQDIEDTYNDFVKGYSKPSNDPDVITRLGDGGCVISDLSFLYEILRFVLKKDMKVAEIGVWTGKTTLLLGSAVKEFNGEVYAIDHFKGQTSLDPKKGHPQANFEDWSGGYNIPEILIRNLQVHKIDDVVNVMKSSSIEASKAFNDSFFDFIFIDASHDYDSVKEDLDSWYPKLKIGGIIAGHDFTEKLSLKKAQELWNNYKEKFVDCKCHPGVLLAVIEKFPGVNNGLGRIWYYQKGEHNEQSIYNRRDWN